MTNLNFGLQEKFIYPKDDPVINDAMTRHMQKKLSEWRHTMKKHWEKVGGETNNNVAKTKPFNGVSSADWVILCDHWASDTHQV